MSYDEAMADLKLVKDEQRKVIAKLRDALRRVKRNREGYMSQTYKDNECWQIATEALK